MYWYPQVEPKLFKNHSTNPKISLSKTILKHISSANASCITKMTRKKNDFPES
jgi:hypothetical protein